MTALIMALIMALFCAAALVAVASIWASVKRHVGGVIDLLSQREGSDPSTCGQRTHRVYTRHVKPLSGWRARARARRAGRIMRGHSQLAARQNMPERKAVHKRHYGFRLTQLSDRLAIE